jgi:hypothetical protein
MLRLLAHLKVRGGAQDITDALNSAIELWLREQAQLHAGCDPASVRGYQWKSLFLPEGTEIRSWSYGEHNYARVEGDEIIHKGKSVTPNEFAQSFARSMRNAWLDLHIRRPEDKQFKIAHRLRLELAQQAKQPRPPPMEAPDVSPVPSVPSVPSMVPAAPRDPTPGQGWTLPERRKYRYRLEDVAFD